VLHIEQRLVQPIAVHDATLEIRPGVLCEIRNEYTVDLFVASWSANRIQTRVQTIVAQHATL
jgi:hypothetical protein